MPYTFKAEKSTYTVSMINLKEHDAEYEIVADWQGMEGPEDYHNFEWYYAVETPCLGGDNLHIGLGKKHFVVVHDGWGHWFKRPSSIPIQRLLRFICTQPDACVTKYEL